jgi:hypothetical protein
VQLQREPSNLTLWARFDRTDDAVGRLPFRRDAIITIVGLDSSGYGTLIGRLNKGGRVGSVEPGYVDNTSLETFKPFTVRAHSDHGDDCASDLTFRKHDLIHIKGLSMAGEGFREGNVDGGKTGNFHEVFVDMTPVTSTDGIYPYFARARYSHTTEEEGLLSYDAGNLIRVTALSTEHYVDATIDGGPTGLVLMSYIKKEDSYPYAARAYYNSRYGEDADETLKFSMGDLILITGKGKDGGVEGRFTEAGETGIFSKKLTRKVTYVRASLESRSTEPDDLSYNQNDIIRLIEPTESKNVWKGELRGKIGSFYAQTTYVADYKDDTLLPPMPKGSYKAWRYRVKHDVAIPTTLY